MVKLVSERAIHLCDWCQVFDLDKEAPGKVLHQFYFNIEKLKQSGDILASEIQNRLRIIVSALFVN